MTFNELKTADLRLAMLQILEEDAGYSVNEYLMDKCLALLGHPAQNAPAYGWVEGLKREGSLLLAKLKHVLPEFADLVKQGTYKKRSISLYPDLTLRHIGFLGGAAPAVKGLADIAFSDRDAVTLEFGEEDRVALGFFQRLKNWIVGKDGPEIADGIFPEDALETLRMEIVQDQLEEDTPQPATYTEDPMELEKLNQKLAEFTETIKQNEAVIAALEARLQTERDTTARKEFAEFLETPEMQRRIPEGSRAATLTHLLLLAQAPAVAFTEADGTIRTVPAVAQYQAALQGLPPVVTFTEVAKAGKTVTGTAGERLSAAITQKLAANRDLTYNAAFTEVQREQPELAHEYATEMKEA